jgi:hypothetical protein
VDVVEALWPGEQLVFEVDHSSGHTKTKSNGLQVSEMNKGVGGKQRKMRSSEIIEGCLGDYAGKCLKVGDVQSMVFLDTEQPHFSPYNQLPKYDQDKDHMSESQKKSCQTQIDKEKADRQEKINAYKKKNNNAEPSPSRFPEIDETMVIRGYVGQAKGVQQVLWERGLWRDKMIMTKNQSDLNKLILARKGLPDPDFNADAILGSCPDFQGEKSALSEVVETRGHILLLSVKCHPEMAGCGVEYCWGISKRTFRKDNRSRDQQTSKNLVKRVRDTLCHKTVLRLDRVWAFERRTRTYMYMYRDIGLNKEDGSLSYTDLEEQMKLCKTHRNIEETERIYLRAFK